MEVPYNTRTISMSSCLNTRYANVQTSQVSHLATHSLQYGGRRCQVRTMLLRVAIQA